MDKVMHRQYCASVILLLFSMTGIMLGTLLYDSLQVQLVTGLRSQFVLDSSSSGSYSSWQDSDDPDAGVVYSTFYVYNLTNPDEVLSGGKPNVVAFGPLKYLYHNKKYNVTWDAQTDNDIVEFREYQYYTVADNATAQIINTPILNINLPLLGVLSNFIAATTVASTPQLAAYKDPSALFITRGAQEWLFGWDNDPFLVAFNQYKNDPLIPDVPTNFPGLQGNDSSLDYALSTHSTIRMYTGRHTVDKMMEYEQWNGFRDMECCLFGPCGDSNSGRGVEAGYAPWGSADANAVAGAQGSQFKIQVTCDDVLRVATYDFSIYSHWNMQCSSSDTPSSTYSVNGIQLLKFQLSPDSLDNYTMNPAMGIAYNSYGPSGLRNQSNCNSGVPVYLSKPLFLDGDARLAAALQNFPPPDRSLHDTYLGVEPITGSTLDFHWRVGVNVLVSPVATVDDLFIPFTFFANVTPVFHPVAWGGQDSTITDSQAADFKSSVYLARDVILGVRYGGISLCGLAGLIALVCFAAAEWRRRTLKYAAEHAENAYVLVGSAGDPAVYGGMDVASINAYRPVV